MTASIAGIASLALEVSRILHDYYVNIESAPKDIETLTREVEGLTQVLNQLETFLDGEAMKSNSFDQTASVLATTLEDCKATLDNLEKVLKLPMKGAVAKTLRRLIWPFRKEQVLKMVDSFRRYNQIFQFSLTVEGW